MPRAGLMRSDGLTEAWTKLTYHPEQARLWNCKSRFVAVPAGRGSGKSELAKRRLVRFLPVKKQWDDPRYFYAAPTFQQAKRIAWNHLLRLIPSIWVDRDGTSISELVIRTIFGSELWVVGLDKPQRIEGVQWDGGVVDESCDVKPGTVDLSILPAMTWRDAWLWRIGVPKRFGIGAKEFRDFYLNAAAGKIDGASAFTWSSEDILPAAALKYAKATMDLRDYREQFRAQWQDASGGVFHAFTEEYNVRPCQYHSDKPIIVGSDFNVDPMAWILCHQYGNRLEAFDEIWIRNTNTQATLKLLKERYKGHTGGWQFYGDASGKYRKSSAALTDYIQITNDQDFKEMGRTIHYLQSNPPVADRFASMNALIKNGEGEVRLHIDRRCKHLIDDLQSRQFKPGTNDLPTDEGDIGHISDALGYIIYKKFPLRVKVSNAPEIIVSGGTEPIEYPVYGEAV